MEMVALSDVLWNRSGLIGQLASSKIHALAQYISYFYFLLAVHISVHINVYMAFSVSLVSALFRRPKPLLTTNVSTVNEIRNKSCDMTGY